MGHLQKSLGNPDLEVIYFFNEILFEFGNNLKLELFTYYIEI